MMNQGPPQPGYRTANFNGVDKVAPGHSMASPGSFPSQQFPPNMSNGPQMNGPGTQTQGINQQYGAYDQRPSQQTASKMSSPYQAQLHTQPPMHYQGQRPGPTQQYQQPPHSTPSPNQYQQQSQPKGVSPNQHAQPPQARGMPQQAQAQKPSVLPEQHPPRPSPTQQKSSELQQPPHTSGPVQQVNQQFSNLHLGGAGPSLPTMSQPLSSWSQQPGHLPESQQYRGPAASTVAAHPTSTGSQMTGSANRPLGPPTSMHPPQPGMAGPQSSRPGPPSGPQMAPPMNMATPHSGMGQPPMSRAGHPSQMPPTSYPGLQVSMSGPSYGAGIGSSNPGPTGMGSGPYGMSGPPTSVAAGAPPAGNRRIYPGQSPPSPVNSQPGSMGMQHQTAPSGYPSAGPMGGMPPHNQGHTQHRGMPPGHMPPGPMPMNSPMQQQKRIDPDQMPSPIQVMKDDINLHKDTPFFTNVRSRIPPLVTSNFSIRDNGNCSPRFMRCTMYNIPCNKDLIQACEIPLATVITPFADVPPTEAPLRIVGTSPSGPVRCNRCKAYINPFVQFIDGGRRFACNICSYSSEVPGDYFCHLDHQGIRVDVYDRPELHLGSYEFVATADYCKDQKLPSPPAYIFMIDVSYQSIQCGMVRMLTREIKELLDHLPKEAGQEHSLIKVGFVTYNSQLHFYNVKGTLAQPQMMVVSDVEDVFVPLLDGFLVNVQEARSVVDSLLEQIPVMFGDTRETEAILGPVIQAGLDALKSAGIAGKLFVFHSSLPTGEAPGKLKNREDRKLLGTEKEKTILNPQTNFYEKLAQECVGSSVSVDLFLFPNAYIDVATIGSVATLTGGEIYRYSYFRESTHGEQFRGDLLRDIEKNIGFDAIMRLRCSTGLRPVDFWGNCYMSNTTDVELAAVDPNKAIAIEIKHDDKLQEDSQAYFQVALLYTSISGQRRLRVHNLAFATCTQLSELFRCCEMDTFVNVVSKQAVRQVYTSSPKAIRDSLIQQCATILACYRRHCASPSSAGQLILPECMKLLPLYVNCVIKNDALLGGSEMSSDDRSWLMRAIMAMDQNASVPFFYPRLLPLHDMDVESNDLPQAIRCSADRMLDTGVYLLENGISLFMWIGLQVDPSWLQQVFDGSTIGQVDIEMTSLPALDNPLSVRVRGIIEHIRAQRKHYLKLTIVRQRDKLEAWFKHYLVEDKGPNTVANSYVDFLCVMHKEIRSLLN